MSITYRNLIDDVEGHLYSYGMQRDKVTTLVQGISSQDTTLQVTDPQQVDRGLLEIDQELMAVQTVDRGAGTVTLHPWGRGQRGTIAASHAGNTKVVASPRFPRSSIAKAVQKTVHSMYPDLYRVRIDESVTASAGVVTHPMPVDADSVISVSYELPGPSRAWQQISRYRMYQNANTLDFPTGRSIDIYESILPGRPIRIVYRGAFETFTSENQSLDAVGLQDRWADLIVFGAAGSLILGMEPLRLQSDAVETQERAEGVQPTQATTVARQLLGMFKQRIIEERSLLHRQHPPVITRHIRSV